MIFAPFLAIFPQCSSIIKYVQAYNAIGAAHTENHGAYSNLIRKHVPLNGDVLCPNRTSLVPFLREKPSIKIWSPKNSAVNGAIIRIL